MENTMTDQLPRVGVAAMVVRDGKILMMQRKGAHGTGTWSVPGGHLEFSEEPEQAAAREVCEEIGCKISNWTSLGFTNDIFDGKDTGKHYITLWYGGVLSKSSEPYNCEPEKCAGMKWVGVDNLPTPLFKSWERVLGGDIERSIRDFVTKTTGDTQ